MTSGSHGDQQREALRQQMLLRALLGDALLGDARPGVVAGWLRGASSSAAGPRVEHGLAAYRSNAGALAERALAAAFPTLQQLIGEASFAALARAFWRQQPPTAGDIALWGAQLPRFVAAAESLADEPYLADVARVEWAVHQAAGAADAAAVQGLDLLATHEPTQLCLQLVPGTAIVESPHPVVTIWQAHRSHDEARFVPVRAALAAGQGETALIFREGWAPRVLAMTAAEARFTAALLAGKTLGAALQQAGETFDFQTWFIAALQQQRLSAVAQLAEGLQP